AQPVRPQPHKPPTPVWALRTKGFGCLFLSCFATARRRSKSCTPLKRFHGSAICPLGSTKQKCQNATPFFFNQIYWILLMNKSILGVLSALVMASAVAPAMAETVEFTVINDSSVDLHYFYTTPSSDEAWGEDLLADLGILEA